MPLKLNIDCLKGGLIQIFSQRIKGMIVCIYLHIFKKYITIVLHAPDNGLVNCKLIECISHLMGGISRYKKRGL